MKSLKTVSFLLFAIMVSFVSCSKDEVEVKGEKPYMVGSWMSIEEDYGLTFNANGTGYETEDGKTNRFRYDCVANKTRPYDYDIIFYFMNDLGEIIDTSDPEHVMIEADNRCKLFDSEGGYDYTLVRTEDNKPLPTLMVNGVNIIGRWSHEFNRDDVESFVFLSDGTGYVEFSLDVNDKEYYKYSVKGTKIYMTLIGEDYDDDIYVVTVTDDGRLFWESENLYYYK